MTESRCPYLVRERTMYRENLDVSRSAPMTVVITWYCEHPFHGIRMELGDARAAAEGHCGSCALPRPQLIATEEQDGSVSPEPERAAEHGG